MQGSLGYRTDGRGMVFLSCIYTFFTQRTLGALSFSSAWHDTTLHMMMWAGWMMMADDCHKRNLLAKQLLCSKKPLWDGAWSGLIHWWGKMSQIKRQFMLEDATPCSYPTSWTQVAFSMQEPSPSLTDTNGPSGDCGIRQQRPRGKLQQSQALHWHCHPWAWLWPARTGWPCSPALSAWSSNQWGITQNTAMFATQNQNIQSLTQPSFLQSNSRNRRNGAISQDGYFLLQVLI